MHVLQLNHICIFKFNVSTYTLQSYIDSASRIWDVDLQLIPFLPFWVLFIAIFGKVAADSKSFSIRIVDVLRPLPLW